MSTTITQSQFEGACKLSTEANVAWLQVLVYHDLLGMMQHPHHAKVTPKFCKQYANLGIQIEGALRAFNEEVKTRAFPSPSHTPYKISGENSGGQIFQWRILIYICHGSETAIYVFN